MSKNLVSTAPTHKMQSTCMFKNNYIHIHKKRCFYRKKCTLLAVTQLLTWCSSATMWDIM